MRFHTFSNSDLLLAGNLPDSFTLEDVKLNPKVFQQARRELQFKPSADMFASYKHHQLPRCYSRMADPRLRVMMPSTRTGIWNTLRM